MRFVLQMQRRFNIQKLINVVHQTKVAKAHKHYNRC